MELLYHEGMAVPRQEGSLDTGRVNQKRRTRSAIVDAAKELMAQGVAPTVAQAAEAAFVSRTTAYRYFPTQESLLIEVGLTASVEDIEALVAQPVDRTTARERALEVIDTFVRHTFADEAQYRMTMRVYQGLWLDAPADKRDGSGLREARRRRWLEQSLRPLRDDVTAEEWRRLLTALSLVTGPESLVVYRDVSRLDVDQACAVARWTATCILDATFGPVRKRAKR